MYSTFTSTFTTAFATALTSGVATTVTATVATATTTATTLRLLVATATTAVTTATTTALAATTVATAAAATLTSAATILALDRLLERTTGTTQHAHAERTRTDPEEAGLALLDDRDHRLGALETLRRQTLLHRFIERLTFEHRTCHDRTPAGHAPSRRIAARGGRTCAPGAQHPGAGGCEASWRTRARRDPRSTTARTSPPARGSSHRTGRTEVSDA